MLCKDYLLAFVKIKKYDDALHYINLAVQLVESTDYLYKYILRGEVWADRWNLLYNKQDIETAENENR